MFMEMLSMFMENKIENGCSIDKYIKIILASDLYKQIVETRLCMKIFLSNHQNFLNCHTTKNFHTVFALLLIHYHA